MLMHSRKSLLFNYLILGAFLWLLVPATCFAGGGASRNIYGVNRGRNLFGRGNFGSKNLYGVSSRSGNSLYGVNRSSGNKMYGVQNRSSSSLYGGVRHNYFGPSMFRSNDRTHSGRNTAHEPKASGREFSSEGPSHEHSSKGFVEAQVYPLSREHEAREMAMVENAAQNGLHGGEGFTPRIRERSSQHMVEFSGNQ